MTTPADRNRVRTLAAEYAELVNGDDMARRREKWRRSNRLLERTVPFHIEDNGTFFADLTPQPQCEGEFERGCEAHFLRCLTNLRFIPDDRVFPASFWVPWQIRRTSVCPELKLRRVPDHTGRDLGYETNTPLADLEPGLRKLRPTEFRVNREATWARAEQAEALFGDLLPARRSGETLMVGPAEDIIHLIGMEDLYVAMYDAPDRVHEMMDRLLDDYAESLDEMEKRGLILPTAGDEALPQGSYCFTDSLPSAGSGLQTRQVWGYMDAEEMNDVSPEMYRAFITDHYRRIAQRFGALSFGCCEAIHRVWDGGVETLPNLRKVSVSAWCDQRFMGDRLRGRDIVYLRKPTANLLGIGSSLHEDAVRAYFRETAEAASGCRLEIAQRDVYLLNGSPAKVPRYVQLVREALDRHWRP
jgi:hypothetical protein